MTKDAVLAILRKENDYISGEHISRLLGVSRAAVNTAVKALRAEGYEISSSTNKGYHLDAVPNSISAQELAAYLDEARMQTVECLASVDSTNNRLRELALAGAPNGQVVLANEQTQGKGRRGRAFASPQDNGIYLSILFHPDTLPTASRTSSIREPVRSTKVRRRTKFGFTALITFAVSMALSSESSLPPTPGMK